MQTVLLDRLRKQLLFGVESHFIGAPGGGQHRDDDAHDRHNDNDADRHDQARLVPPRPLPFPGDVRRAEGNTLSSFAVTGWLTLLGRKAFQSLAICEQRVLRRGTESRAFGSVMPSLISR